MKRTFWFLLPGLLLLVPVCAQAQTGCIHSPECPTALLGIVGAGGAALYTKLRSK